MNDADALSLLDGMVRIASYSREEAAIAAYITERMRTAGFHAEIDGAGNAVGTIGSGPIHVCLLGHMDTAPGYVPIVVEDGRLFGRGAVDAKGPLATFIAAASRYTKRGGACRFTIVGCVEEEVPSSKGAHFVKDKLRPDVCVIGEPSGWDGITLGYKGYLKARLHLAQDVMHSAYGQPTVGDRACAVWQGIVTAAEEINRGKERLFDRLLPALMAINTESDGCRAQARLDINLRLPPQCGVEAAQELVAAAAASAGADIVFEGGMEAYSGPRTTLLVRSLAAGIRSQGGTPRYLLKTGTADMNIVAPLWGCPTVAYGPGDCDLDHAPNEHIELEEFVKSVAILDNTFTQLASSIT